MTPDFVLVEKPHDGGLRPAHRELLEDAADNGSLTGLDFYPVSLGPLAPLLVHSGSAAGDRPVAEGLLADEVAALLLADLPTQGPLPQVAQLKLVEDAPDLDGEGSILLGAVQAVGDSDHPDSVESKFREGREHQVGVAGEPREVIDKDDLEAASAACVQQSRETVSVAPCAGRGHVHVDVLISNDEPAPIRLLPTGSDLIFDALGSLVLAAEPRVDACDHRCRSGGMGAA